MSYKCPTSKSKSCKVVDFTELTRGFEPPTSSLPRKCSTPELRQHTKKAPITVLFSLSGKRDSNSQPSAWKADALPIELFPQRFLNVGRAGFEPAKT